MQKDCHTVNSFYRAEIEGYWKRSCMSISTFWKKLSCRLSQSSLKILVLILLLLKLQCIKKICSIFFWKFEYYHTKTHVISVFTKKEKENSDQSKQIHVFMNHEILKSMKTLLAISMILWIITFFFSSKIQNAIF